jgi:hypothetical protein
VTFVVRPTAWHALLTLKSFTNSIKVRRSAVGKIKQFFAIFFVPLLMIMRQCSGFGTVFRGQRRSDTLPVAIKTMPNLTSKQVRSLCDFSLVYHGEPILIAET